MNTPTKAPPNNETPITPPPPTIQTLIAQKIKMLRKAKGTSQDDLGAITLTNQAKISRTESGSEEYNQRELEIIKEFFGIADMPLAEDERAPFRENLYHWLDLIRSRRMDEASDIREKLSPAINLEPCDPDLSILYRLFEVTYFLAENKLDTADEKLSIIHGKLGDENIEHLYYYHFNVGSLHVMRNSYEEALKSYSQALKISERHKDFLPEYESRLYYNISKCYTEIELPNRALVFLQKIPRANFEKRTSSYFISLDIMIVVNYIKIGELDWAENLLDECLVRAKGIYDSFLVGLTLYNLGILYRRRKNWGKAIGYLDQAMDIFGENLEYYAGALYHKIRCLIEVRDFSEAEKLINKARADYCEDDGYLALFEILVHILTINKRMSAYNEESANYIEDFAIPYFIKNHDRLEAAECCELLEQHYMKTRKKVKTLAIRATMGNIYKEMFIRQREW